MNERNESCNGVLSECSQPVPVIAQPNVAVCVEGGSPPAATKSPTMPLPKTSVPVDAAAQIQQTHTTGTISDSTTPRPDIDSTSPQPNDIAGVAGNAIYDTADESTLERNSAEKQRDLQTKAGEVPAEASNTVAALEKSAEVSAPVVVLCGRTNIGDLATVRTSAEEIKATAPIVGDKSANGLSSATQKTLPLAKSSRPFSELAQGASVASKNGWEAWHKHVRTTQGNTSHNFGVQPAPTSQSFSVPNPLAGACAAEQIAAVSSPSPYHCSGELTAPSSGASTVAPAALAVQMQHCGETALSHTPTPSSGPPTVGERKQTSGSDQPPAAYPGSVSIAAAGLPPSVTALDLSRAAESDFALNALQAAEAAVLQHQASLWTAHNQAAANAAELHLQWSLRAVNQSLDGKSEDDDRKAHEKAQRDQLECWLRHYTLALARSTATGTNSAASTGVVDLSGSLGGSSDPESASDPVFEEIQPMAASEFAMDDKPSQKRSHSLPGGGGNGVVVGSKRRRSVPATAQMSTPLTHPGCSRPGNAPVGLSVLSQEHLSGAQPPAGYWPSASAPAAGSQLHQSRAEAVGRAVNSTAHPNAPPIVIANKPKAPRRVDTPMTYLVRQLLGQVEVVGDEPAVVLGPQLVKDAALKIRVVVDKLVEITVDKTRQECLASFAAAEALSEANKDRSARASSSENVAANMAVDDSLMLAQEQKNMETLKKFAQVQVIKVNEQRLCIDNLQQKLDNNLFVINEQRRELESLREGARHGSKVPTNVQNLVKQLDGGIAIIQHQKKGIEVLEAQVKKSASDLKEKDNIIAFLRARLESEESKVRQLRTEFEKRRHERPLEVEASSQKQREIDRLTKEIRELEEALNHERRQGEQTIRAYMRAAVHGLKIRRQLDSEGE
jgi:hypothetical protein